MTDAERKRLWRRANPEKRREQQRRYRAKKRALGIPDEQKAKQAGYAKAFKERHGEEYRARKAKHSRDRYRRLHGIPLDAPIGQKPHASASEEERRERRKAANRRAWAKANGTTVEEIDARNAARKAAKEAREKCQKVKTVRIPAKISERKTSKRLRKSISGSETAKPSSIPIRSATTRAPARPISNRPRPGLLTLRSLGKWWF
jgi:hypothetical protein